MTENPAGSVNPKWVGVLAFLQNKSVLRIAIFIGLFLLLFSRRWQQLSLPQVWDEDGSQIIPSFLELGWATFLKPVSGYLITVPKLISALSLRISFSEYPLISTILTGVFSAIVGLAVWLSPTSLRGKFFCTLSIFCIPSNPECFGLPLYTLWWSSILLFLVCLWREAESAVSWRIIFLLLGGLSSPVIVMVVPILWLRTFWKGARRSDQFLALLATLIAAIQLNFILEASSGKLTSLSLILNNVVPRFFGNFLVGNLLDPNILTLWIAGLAILGLSIAWVFANWRDRTTWVLCLLLWGSIGLSVARVDPSGIHPLAAGPRYFFFPFILIFWVLAQSAHESRLRWVHYGSVALIAIALLNSVPAWTRVHGDLLWKEHVFSARFFPSYSIPIQFDGHVESAWTAANGSGLTISGKSCKDLLDQDPFLRNQSIADLPTFPYVVDSGEKFIAAKRQNHTPLPPLFPATTMKVNRKEQPADRNFAVFDSKRKNETGLGIISLKIKRGALVRYRSGPNTNCQRLIIEGSENKFLQQLPIAKDWVTLDFSNNTLPQKFVIRIEDPDQSDGEWSEVAYR